MVAHECRSPKHAHLQSVSSLQTTSSELLEKKHLLDAVLQYLAVVLENTVCVFGFPVQTGIAWELCCCPSVW